MPKRYKAAVRKLCDDPASCRERLLHAAGMLHAERGLESVSTRELTAAADANLAAIAYYFGSKDGLRNAVIDHVIERTTERVGSVFAQLARAVAEAEGERDKLARAAAEFVAAYLAAALPVDPRNWTLTVIMRAMSEPSEAEGRIYEAVFAPMLAAVHSLVAAAIGHDVDSIETRLLATATFGEMWTFRRNRAVLLRELGWDEFTADRIEQVASIVACRVLSRLGLPLDVLDVPGALLCRTTVPAE